MKFWERLFNKFTPGEIYIMGQVEDLEARLDTAIATVKSAAETVEGLYEEIKMLTGDGITAEAAARLNAKLGVLETELAKVPTDDEETPPPPVEEPTS